MIDKPSNADLDPKSPSLLERTKHLLANSELSPSKIAIQTGLSYYWLRQMQSNFNKSASVDRVQTLYEFLSNKKLFKDANGKFVCPKELSGDK